MKLESVNIKNFRCFKDETIQLDDYNCFVGLNGAGKSTVLNALNVFFKQYKDSKTDLSKLSIDDFHHKDTREPISITVTFVDLSDQAAIDLKDYIRQGKLIVTVRADFNESTQKAEVKQFGSRLGMEEFRLWFEASKSGKSVSDLRSIFKNLQNTFPDLPSATTKANMEESLQNFESNYPDQCVAIQSEDQFYGVSKGSNKLSPHVQWVFVSASKDFSEEADENKNSALGQLLSIAIRSKINFTDKIASLRNEISKQYQDMLLVEAAALHEISESLDKKLKIWANPNVTAALKWKDDTEKSIRIDEPSASIILGEKGFESELARFGHGMQRSYLLTLLQELAEVVVDHTPTLIMAIEEPELYQHPPQVRYLSEVLQGLANKNTQVLVCSHSPHFVPSDNFHQVRIVREVGFPAQTTVSAMTYSELDSKIKDSGGKSAKEEGMVAKLYPVLRPEISEMFFSKRIILVEGFEDVAYLTSYIRLMDRHKEFRKSGYHIIPVGGKSEIIKPLAIAKLLEIPVFVMLDADTNKDRQHEIIKHKSDNCLILKLLGRDGAQNWPKEDILDIDLYMWKTNITDTISQEFGDAWIKHEDKAASDYGNPGGLKKNSLAVARALEYAWNSDLKSEKLQKLVEKIFQAAIN